MLQHFWPSSLRGLENLLLLVPALWLAALGCFVLVLSGLNRRVRQRTQPPPPPSRHKQLKSWLPMYCAWYEHDQRVLGRLGASEPARRWCLA